MASERFRAGMAQLIYYMGDVYGAASALRVPPELIVAIVAHESQAKERRAVRAAVPILSPLAGLVLDDPADTYERMEATVRGDKASIGIAQMQVGLARRLRAKFPSVARHASVVDDLLDRSVAVWYVAAALRELRDNLDAFLARQGAKLAEDEVKDLTALGYNIGWEALRDRNLLAADMGADVPARVAKVRQDSSYIRATIGQWRE